MTDRLLHLAFCCHYNLRAQIILLGMLSCGLLFQPPLQATLLDVTLSKTDNVFSSPLKNLSFYLTMTYLSKNPVEWKLTNTLTFIHQKVLSQVEHLVFRLLVAAPMTDDALITCFVLLLRKNAIPANCLPLKIKSRSSLPPTCRWKVFALDDQRRQVQFKGFRPVPPI